MIVLFSVSKGIPSVYLFAVTSAVAVFPLFEAVAEVIFHFELLTVYVTSDSVQVAELPVYLKVAYNVADQHTIPSSSLYEIDFEAVLVFVA